MMESFRAAVAPELSIVVPAPADVAALEETLVSVLENRPPAAEVVVALGCEYDDPWNIREEVRFVQAPPGTSLAACANLGIAAAAGRFVHVLAAGWRATEGWTNAPLEHLSRGASAVVPLAVSAADPDCVVAAGVRTTRGGRRIVAASAVGTTARESRHQHHRSPSAPLLEAGFWTADLLAACGGFSTACGDWLADADMAAVLTCCGTVVLEPGSRVIGGPLRSQPTAFSAGLLSERLFWRSLAGQPLLPALLAHGVEVLRDAAAAAPFGTLPRLVGRLAGLLEFGGHVERARHLAALRANRDAEDSEQAADAATLRIDDAHRRLSRPRRRTSPAPLKRSA